MSTESAIYEIRLKDRFSAPLGGLESKMNRFEGKIGNIGSAFTSLGGTMLGAFSGGLLAGGIESIITGIKNIGVEAVNTARQFRNMEEAIAFASGKDAQTNLKFLDDTINRLGLDVNATYKGFKTWQGALMGTNLEGEKGREIFTSVSEAATVMKLSGEMTEGAFLALGQMISKGTVSAEELRGQLGERLPGAFQIAARAMGVTTSKLGDMMKKGEVVAEDFLPKFATELKKTFGPGVLEAQESFNANMNRFSNFVLRGRIALGESLIPAINDLVKIIPSIDFTPLLYTFTQLKHEIIGVFDAFGSLMNLFGVSLTTFEKVALAFRVIAGVFRFSATPIRVVIFAFSEFITLLKGSVGILHGVGEIMVGIFTKNFTLIEQGIDRVGKSWKTFLSESSSKTGAFWHDEKEGWSKIFGPLNDPSKDNAYANGNGGVNGNGKGAGAATGKTSTAGVEKISSGTRNITVNITNLVGAVTFQKMDGTTQSQVTDMVKRALLSAVNDVNIVAQ